MCGMRRKKANAPGLVRGLLLVALCAAGVVGCSREAEKADAPPPYVPESYMKDPEFRKMLKEQRLARNRVVNERAAVLEKMQEVERGFKGDASKFERNPEWKKLRAKLVELNARYEALRKEQLRTVSARLAPSVPKDAQKKNDVSKKN